MTDFSTRLKDWEKDMMDKVLNGDFNNRHQIGGRGRSTRDAAEGLMREIDDAYRCGGPSAVHDLVNSKYEQTHKAPPLRHPMQNDENRYGGVCVGGPRDGRNLTSSSPTVSVVDASDSSFYTADYARVPPDRVAAHTSGYDYIALTPQIGVWAYEDLRESGVSLADAVISRLLEGYGSDPVAQGDDDA
tara:strand:- start:2045 stop:2608 length:564 start_codon:yes stop_codon:yes gene_type:complete